LQSTAEDDKEAKSMNANEDDEGDEEDEDDEDEDEMVEGEDSVMQPEGIDNS
jgi:hypothetical protein